MHILIDIPEYVYESAKAMPVIYEGGRLNGKTHLQMLVNKTFSQILVNSVRNGTPLPKGHGRLIDADAVDTRYSDPDVVNTLDNAPTIIEADKESK